MTLGRFISIASLLGALSIVGCGGSAKNVCENCDVSERRDECENYYNNCDGVDCEVEALALCSVL